MRNVLALQALDLSSPDGIVVPEIEVHGGLSTLSWNCCTQTGTAVN